MYEGMMEFMYEGGWIMWLILLLALLGLFASAERTLVLGRIRLGSRSERRRLDELLESGQLNDLGRLAGRPVGRVLAASARYLDGSPAQIEAALELEARRESRRLYRKLGLLGMVVITAPLCGFFGTVTGLMAVGSYYSLAVSMPQYISAGISEALVTSAAGLLVAIPAQLALTTLRSWAERSEAEIEDAVNRVLLELE